MKSPIFRDVTQCSPLKVNRRFGGTYRLCFHAGFLLGLFLNPEDRGDSFLRNVDAFQRTTWRYTPEDRNFQDYICWWRKRNWLNTSVGGLQNQPGYGGTEKKSLSLSVIELHSLAFSQLLCWAIPAHPCFTKIQVLLLDSNYLSVERETH
jgi:hypothetical protein